MTSGETLRITEKNSIIYCVSEQKCYEVEKVYNNGVLTFYKNVNIYGVDMSEGRFFSYNELLDRDYRLL